MTVLRGLFAVALLVVSSADLSAQSSGALRRLRILHASAGSLPSQPSSPNPSDTATGVSTSPTLSASTSGQASCTITGPNTSNPPTTDQAPAGTCTYSASGLSASTTYYWKACATNTIGTSCGSVWSFTTAAPGSWTLRVNDTFTGTADSSLLPPTNVTDSDHPDESDITWAQPHHGSAGIVRIDSNGTRLAVVPQPRPFPNYIFKADQASEATFYPSTDSGLEAGVTTRYTMFEPGYSPDGPAFKYLSSFTGYYAIYNHATPDLRFLRGDLDGNQHLLGIRTGSLSDGVVIRLESVGTAHVVKLDSATVTWDAGALPCSGLSSCTDTTYPSGGYPGLFVGHAASSTGSIDNFNAYDQGSASSSPVAQNVHPRLLCSAVSASPDDCATMGARLTGAGAWASNYTNASASLGGIAGVEANWSVDLSGDPGKLARMAMAAAFVYYFYDTEHGSSSHTKNQWGDKAIEWLEVLRGLNYDLTGITSITRSGSTATVTRAGHGMSSNTLIGIYGANEPEFNITAIATVTDADHFTYPLVAVPAATTATGTFKWSQGMPGAYSLFFPIKSVLYAMDFAWARLSAQNKIDFFHWLRTIDGESHIINYRKGISTAEQIARTDWTNNQTIESWTTKIMAGILMTGAGINDGWSIESMNLYHTMVRSVSYGYLSRNAKRGADDGSWVQGNVYGYSYDMSQITHMEGAWRISQGLTRTQWYGTNVNAGRQILGYPIIALYHIQPFGEANGGQPGGHWVRALKNTHSSWFGDIDSGDYSQAAAFMMIRRELDGFNQDRSDLAGWMGANLFLETNPEWWFLTRFLGPKGTYKTAATIGLPLSKAMAYGEWHWLSGHVDQSTFNNAHVQVECERTNADRPVCGSLQISYRGPVISRPGMGGHDPDAVGVGGFQNLVGALDPTRTTGEGSVDCGPVKCDDFGYGRVYPNNTASDFTEDDPDNPAVLANYAPGQHEIINSLTRSGSTATATVPSPRTITGNGMATGDVICMAGWDQPEYNVCAAVTVIDSTNFSFPVSGSPASPATGIGYWSNVKFLGIGAYDSDEKFGYVYVSQNSGYNSDTVNDNSVTGVTKKWESANRQVAVRMPDTPGTDPVKVWVYDRGTIKTTTNRERRLTWYVGDTPTVNGSSSAGPSRNGSTTGKTQYSGATLATVTDNTNGRDNKMWMRVYSPTTLNTVVVNWRRGTNNSDLESPYGEVQTLASSDSGETSLRKPYASYNRLEFIPTTTNLSESFLTCIAVTGAADSEPTRNQITGTGTYGCQMGLDIGVFMTTNGASTGTIDFPDTTATYRVFISNGPSATALTFTKGSNTGTVTKYADGDTDLIYSTSPLGTLEIQVPITAGGAQSTRRISWVP
jgi:hypothetical protein